MNREIERRFLVNGPGWEHCPAVFYRQAYLQAEPGCTVRVRLAADPSNGTTKAWLTIKGPSEPNGLSRDEFEYVIPYSEGEALFALARHGTIEKWRRIVDVGPDRWVVDVFLGANQGLVLAEIELDSETAAFGRPAWLGREVTGDPRYANASLARCPFTTWTGQAGSRIQIGGVGPCR